jgi:hypothetical protein
MVISGAVGAAAGAALLVFGFGFMSPSAARQKADLAAIDTAANICITVLTHGMTAEQGKEMQKLMWAGPNNTDLMVERFERLWRQRPGHFLLSPESVGFRNFVAVCMDQFLAFDFSNPPVARVSPGRS